MEEAKAVAFGKAVGDATRQRILRYCCCQQRSVGEIARHAGVGQPTASHHLAVLERAGLVVRNQEGKLVYYSVDQGAVVECCGQLLLKLAPEEKATRLISKCCG